MTTSESPIVIVISALSDELHAFTQNRGTGRKKLVWDQYTITVSNHFICKKGNFTLGNKNLLIYAADAANNMGMTEATLLATKAILSCEKYFNIKPAMLAMIGVCGGIQKDNSEGDEFIGIGDIITTDIAVHFFFGKMNRDQPGKPIFAKGTQSSLTDSPLYNHLTNFFTKGGKSLLSQIQNAYTGQSPSRNLFSHSGTIASSDLVVANEDILLQAKDVGGRKTIAVDMESYSVLKVASHFKVPGMVLKSVSDYANPDKGSESEDRYRKYAYHTSAEALYLFLKYLVEKTDFFLQKTTQV